ncbi:MAG TPA: single-stranded-DNA-specific exonuclease RecJ [Candidatus Limnocylindria bacterium]|jgi:single-stranded-DNA-specific exonuclease|nr:single-stranded-DNA-specific exonuclease RecJ [Candidatus Limnocylindria bacterium]
MSLVAQRRWIMPTKPGNVPDGIPALVAEVLAGRGLAAADMAAFLAARPAEEGPPMLDLDRVVERLRRALAARERIVVYGDYDVDGIAGSAILVRAFRQLGAAVGAYIPNRYEEGYGLNSAALRQLAADGATVIVSVDCGVTALEEARVASELGVDLIVTDHHHPPPELPGAYALVNPRRPGDPSLDKDLAGAGVALVLAKRLLGELSYALRQDELLQLCALATVADVVPLRDANRVLTRAGLEALNRAPIVGVRALVERSGLKLGGVGAGEIGFVLGPRLNAAGRITDAEDALRLLLTEDAAEAKELAERLEQRNAERQELTRQVVAGARERAADRADAWVTIVADPEWPAGIVGLGASRLVEDYGRPAIVIAIDGDEGKGSCRSIAGVHIAEALADCDDILIKHGGHAMAAGFSVAVSRIPELVERLDAIVRECLGGVRPVPTIRVDAEIAPELLTAKLAVELRSLEPCGAGNPRPHLLVRDVRVYDIRQVGADSDHLRCKVTVGRFTFDAMAFRRGDHAEAMTDAGRVDAVVTIGSGLRGFVELELRDFGPVGTAALMEAEQAGGRGGRAPALVVS